jgi:two-component system, NarL family, sensor histidine kinase UhpB
LQQGAQEERQRIAADLHDDLGAKLLTIAQTAKNPQHGSRVAELARQALEDMRLAVRGLATNAVSAAELQADWRADLLQRLEVAGIDAQWLGNEPPSSLMITSTAQVQLTRVMRETLSNVIRHSQATLCQISCQWEQDEFLLFVQDDGLGLPSSELVAGLRQGLGLSNIERRIHKLGGLVQWLAVESKGLKMLARIPLASISTAEARSSVNIQP